VGVSAKVDLLPQDSADTGALDVIPTRTQPHRRSSLQNRLPLFRAHRFSAPSSLQFFACVDYVGDKLPELREIRCSVTGSAAPAIMSGLFGAFGGLCVGYDTGYGKKR
jgi:hypothetical protein